MNMKNKNTYLASLVGTVVNGAHTVALIYLIVHLFLSLSITGVDKTKLGVQIALYFAMLIVVGVALSLSIVCVIYELKEKSLTSEEGKRIVLSTVFFDFFVAFLFFINIFTGQTAMGVVFYIICCLLLVLSGGLYLIDYNNNIKMERDSKNKIDNTASMDDSFKKIEEIVFEDKKNDNDK